LGYIASREFIDELSVYWLLKKDSAFWIYFICSLFNDAFSATDYVASKW
jgi:hypothetical protein